MSLRLTGDKALAKELQRLSQLTFDRVVKDNMAEIYNRGQSSSEDVAGGTPQDSGELVGSLGLKRDTVFYSKEYAAHVEYGHRTRGGGWVPGQRYLQKNVEKQKPIFQSDLRKHLNGK